jgi:hypothetical protein
VVSDEVDTAEEHPIETKSAAKIDLLVMVIIVKYLNLYSYFKHSTTGLSLKKSVSFPTFM